MMTLLMPIMFSFFVFQLRLAPTTTTTALSTATVLDDTDDDHGDVDHCVDHAALHDDHDEC